MTNLQRRQLNDFFVHVFNVLLSYEEQAIANSGFSDLSVREIHVLEAADRLAAEGKNTMSLLAEALSVSVSTMTTAVGTLVRKGYLRRESVPQDRRVILVFLTEKGEAANAFHTRYHERMADDAGRNLGEEELDVLLQSLSRLGTFFDRARKTRTEEMAAHGDDGTN